MFKNGGLPGELQHPTDRSETDPTKIAIMMPEPPKKDSKGHLVASVDILDTPCGQIAYQLGKYGFKFGISSRGEGDLIQDFSGEESVDPDTYTLNAFDLVLIPACEDARLQFNEGLEKKQTNKLKTILNESLKNASDKDRKIMEAVLDELDIEDNIQFVDTYENVDIFFDPERKKYLVYGMDGDEELFNSERNAKKYIDKFVLKEQILTEEQVGREETKENTKASEILQNKPENKKEPQDTENNEEVSVTINQDNSQQEVNNKPEEEITTTSEIKTTETNEEKEKLKESTEEYPVEFSYTLESDEGSEDFIGHINIKASSSEEAIKKAEQYVNSNTYQYKHASQTNFRNFKIGDTKYSNVDVVEEFEEDDTPKRKSWDTDFHRLDIAYNHNFKQFKDKEMSSGVIQDFVDDLEASNKDYTIYDHQTDPGCTIFFQESLNKDLNWADLNGTEQSAVEAALAAIKNGSELEDAVHGAVFMYNDANAEPDYEDEDFYMEEADYTKVLEYIKQYLNLNENNNAKLNEDKYTKDELFDKFGTDNLDIINAGNEEKVELADDNDMAILEQLHKALKLNKSLESKIKALQEKISVGYAKEISLKEELDTYKQKLTKLSQKTKEIKILTEKLAASEKALKEAEEQSNNNIKNLNESIKSKDSESKSLKKNISTLNEAVDRKNAKIRSLNESIDKYKDELSSKDNDIKQLQEKYETGQKDLEQLRNQYSKKIERQNQIIEKYQRVAKNSVKRYIESQAVRLGVKSDEIVNRLPKNYSFNDIDKICEDLQEYKFNMSNLPFSNFKLNENLKVTAKNINNGLIEANPEDEITDYDLKLAEAVL